MASILRIIYIDYIIRIRIFRESVMRFWGFLVFSIIFSLTVIFPNSIHAQEESDYGKILSISENIVTINFENRTLGIGDEVSFVRYITIVHPITGKLMGGRYETVATGVVEEVGLDKSQSSILWTSPKFDEIEPTDLVIVTGRDLDFERAKRIIGRVQNLAIEKKEIEIDVGSEEEISEGDLFLIQRTEYIYDPETNEIIDIKKVEVGRGRISSVAQNSSLGEIIFNPGMELNPETDDIVFEFKKEEPESIKPRAKEVIGKVQELINDKKIDIDVGEEEEINEGDLFLVQRTEYIYDQETNEVIDTKKVEVGRGQVSIVAQYSSRGELELNPGMKLNPDTDNIVFEPTYEELVEIALAESSLVQDIRKEIIDLKSELFLLRATVDSLGQEHLDHRNEFEMFKDEIEDMFSSLMMSDMVGSKILIKNDESITPSVSESLVDSYKQALDDCLNYRFETAIKEFQSIINQYPNSKLTENCRYWIAQSYYNMGNYPAAIEIFKAVIEDTRFSHKNDDASIMLGISYYLTGNISEALIEFQKFLINYPDSEYSDKVNYWIQRLS